MFAHRISIIFG